MVVVQLLSHVWLFVTPCTVAFQASLSFTVSWSLHQLMSFESVMPSNHLILCHPLLLLHTIFPSIRVFSSESGLCIRWPKYWKFSFSISPSSEYSGLISFNTDWLYLLAVQGILESSPTPQFKSINSVALSLLYGPILTSIHDYWKNLTFISKGMSLFFNMLSRFVIAFLPRSIFWFHSWSHHLHWFWSPRN